MFKGIKFALAACFLWGFIFIVPQFMTGFSSIEVALGRYFIYGLISFLLFCYAKYRGACSYPSFIWKKALLFSLISTVGYYTFVVLALRYATPAVCALILGVSPILIAFYGNWKHPEVSFKSLILPSLLIIAGLIIINLPHLKVGESIFSYFIGLGCSFFALLAWSFYVVANARFLKKHPEVRSSDWSTLMGVATLFWVLLFAVFLSLFTTNQLQMNKYFTLSSELKIFLLGSGILGLFCSWIGAFLWNRASLHLPLSLAGQLTIFETIFGVLFVYILARQMPSLMEGAGIIILLLSIVFGIRLFSNKSNKENEFNSH